MKKIFLTVCLFSFIFSISAALAQDKVVVVPLSSSNKSGAAFEGASDFIPLPSPPAGPAEIRTVTINVPSAGVIIVNASGYMDLNLDPSAHIQCEITKNSLNFSGDDIYIMGKNNDTEGELMPFGATRGFSVSEPGQSTIRLLCIAATNTSEIKDANLTVMYFPNDLQ